jgi:methionine sulfoxide reductase heme-binding subunit
MAPNPADHTWWLASRASGVVAMILITASVFIGLTLSTRVLKGPGLSRWLAAAHEQAALGGLVAIALHGVTLLGDPFLNPGVKGIAVPFAIDFKTLWVGLGIIGGYLAALTGLTFYARKRIGVARWRKLHRLTIVAYGLSLVHTIQAGTDFQAGSWARLAILAPAFPIMVLFGERMLAGRPRSKPAPAAQPAPTPKPAPRPHHQPHREHALDAG